VQRLRQVNAPGTGRTTTSDANEAAAPIDDQIAVGTTSTAQTFQGAWLARIGLKRLNNKPEDDCRRLPADDFDYRLSVDPGSDGLTTFSDPKARRMPKRQANFMILVKDPIGDAARRMWLR
jgi:hypothetical protein